MVNYNNSIIYKICCKDINIKDIYIGSTTNFNRRKQKHRNLVLNGFNRDGEYNTKVYNFIRDNGDWDNWQMIQIEQYKANNKRHLEQRERYWLEKLKATLNTNKPYITNDEKNNYYNNNVKNNKIYCKFCDSSFNKYFEKKHNISKNHIINFIHF